MTGSNHRRGYYSASVVYGNGLRQQDATPAERNYVLLRIESGVTLPRRDRLYASDTGYTFCNHIFGNWLQRCTFDS